MPDEDKTFSGSFVLDLRIWWRQVHTLYREFKQIATVRLALIRLPEVNFPQNETLRMYVGCI